MGDEPEEIALSGGRRLHLAPDTLSLPELLAVVESGVTFWRQRLASTDGVARATAAAAIKDLSQILDSLATQIALGRETVQVTGCLPAQRLFPLPCAICGRGNRASARYCIACGTPLRPDLQTVPRVSPLPRLQIASRTDIGMVRPVNEDTFYTGEFTTADDTIGTLLIVADGMGGHQAGDVASTLATTTLKTYLVKALSYGVPTTDAGWHELLQRAVLQANQIVYQHAQTHANQQGMGTTMTVALVVGRRVHLGHVGDSRAYLINPAGVVNEGLPWVQLTTDHSLVARLVDIGQITPAQARMHPQRNVVYRSLGGDPTLEVDTRSHALAPGDTLLLCSDGLVNHVEDEELARMVLNASSVAQACAQLVARANEGGGKDNITVVMARVV
nr:Stp1/IreP family PP2C-type Ser/Thr phosphatase [Candidatus Chloroploca asiatica]